MEEELRRLPIRASLVRPKLLLGGERGLVIMSGTLSGVVGLALMQTGWAFFGIIIGFAVWGACLFVLTRIATADPLMSRLYLKHIQYKVFYPAHGRLNAEPKEYKSGM